MERIQEMRSRIKHSNIMMYYKYIRSYSASVVKYNTVVAAL